MLKIRYKNVYSKYELAKKAVDDTLKELKKNKQIGDYLCIRKDMVIKFFLITIGNVYKKHEFALNIDEAKNSNLIELKNKIKETILKKIGCFI